MLLVLVESCGNHDISFGICLELEQFLLRRRAVELDSVARSELAQVADASLDEGDAVIADGDGLAGELAELIALNLRRL